MMCRNRKQRLGELLDFRQKKVLNILTCQNKRGLFLTHTLHAVANILNRRHICEKQIQLVYCGNCISSAEQLIAHIAENVEKQRILEPFVSVHKTFYSETDKLAVFDVCSAVEIFRFRSLAH